MSTIVLVLAFFCGVFVAVVHGLLTDEARGWLPHLARAVVRAAARRLPPAHRQRYEEEWLAELVAYSDRRLTALIRACSLWVSARAMRAELGGEVAPARVSMLDRVVAGLMLLFFAPLLVLIAAAIKIDTRGPVLFRQVRVRPDGRRVRQLRFRTMDPSPLVEWSFGSDDQKRVWVMGTMKNARGELEILPTWEHSRTYSRPTIAGVLGSVGAALRWPVYYPDPRVTRVGRFLRRYSLDELPLLFNVVRGDMAMPYPWRIEGP
jgi:Bacterial sugar transferase